MLPLSGLIVREPCEKARYFWKPNARPELLPEAGARNERTLEAVSSRPLFGAVAWTRALLGPASPDQHLNAHHQLPAGLKCR
jgi:hypothetical protein